MKFRKHEHCISFHTYDSIILQSGIYVIISKATDQWVASIVILHKRAIPISEQARIWFGLTSGLGMPGMPGAHYSVGTRPRFIAHELLHIYIYTYKLVIWHAWGSVATARPTRVINAYRYIGYILVCFDQDPSNRRESGLFYQRNYAASLILIRYIDAI